MEIELSEDLAGAAADCFIEGTKRLCAELMVGKVGGGRGLTVTCLPGLCSLSELYRSAPWPRAPPWPSWWRGAPCRQCGGWGGTRWPLCRLGHGMLTLAEEEDGKPGHPHFALWSKFRVYLETTQKWVKYPAKHKFRERGRNQVNCSSPPFARANSSDKFEAKIAWKVHCQHHCTAGG